MAHDYLPGTGLAVIVSGKQTSDARRIAALEAALARILKYIHRTPSGYIAIVSDAATEAVIAETERMIRECGQTPATTEDDLPAWTETPSGAAYLRDNKSV